MHWHSSSDAFFVNIFLFMLICFLSTTCLVKLCFRWRLLFLCINRYFTSINYMHIYVYMYLHMCIKTNTSFGMTYFFHTIIIHLPLEQPQRICEYWTLASPHFQMININLNMRHFVKMSKQVVVHLPAFIDLYT